MNWNSPAEFFAMGGYALYVWGSFGVCALAFLLEPFSHSQPSETGRANLAPPGCCRKNRNGTHVKRWKKRAAIIGAGLAAVGIAAALVLNALNSNIAAVRHADRCHCRQGAEIAGLPYWWPGQGRYAAP